MKNGDKTDHIFSAIKSVHPVLLHDSIYIQIREECHRYLETWNERWRSKAVASPSCNQGTAVSFIGGRGGGKVAYGTCWRQTVEGKACKCTNFNLNDPPVPFPHPSWAPVKKKAYYFWHQRSGCRCAFRRFILNRCRRPAEQGPSHSARLTSRQTPPSMAKHCPGTVPGGNLDMCVCKWKQPVVGKKRRNWQRGKNRACICDRTCTQRTLGTNRFRYIQMHSNALEHDANCLQKYYKLKCSMQTDFSIFCVQTGNSISFVPLELKCWVGNATQFGTNLSYSVKKSYMQLCNALIHNTPCSFGDILWHQVNGMVVKWYMTLWMWLYWFFKDLLFFRVFLSKCF